MPIAASLSMCNITDLYSSAAVGDVSIPGTNSLCLTMPAGYVLQSGLSPAGATQRMKVHCIPLYFVSFNYLCLLKCVSEKKSLLLSYKKFLLKLRNTISEKKSHERNKTYTHTQKTSAISLFTS
jgi:hypothetical protein